MKLGRFGIVHLVECSFAAQDIPVSSQLMPTHRYIEDFSSTALLATKRFIRVAPEVNSREHVTDLPLPRRGKGCSPRREVTRNPKQGISVATQKGVMSPKT